MNLIKNLYDYRELLKSNVKKDIRGKYKGSFLGVLWSFVNPLLMTLVYAIVFPYILKSSQDHYVTYLVIGLLPWNWFTTVISQGTFCILANSGIIKKVYFPREILPISVNTAGMINYLIQCLIIAIFLLFSGIGFSFYILFLPIIILIQYLLQQGIIFITGAIDVYIRDLEYIVNFVVQMLFYATPILYSSDLFSGTSLEILFKLNPFATIIDSYRAIFYYQQLPELVPLFGVLTFSILLFLVGYSVFKKLQKGFAEEC